MSSLLSGRLRALWYPPRYLAPPAAGIDISASSVKAVRLERTAAGLVLAGHAALRLPPGAVVAGDVRDRTTVAAAVAHAAALAGIGAGAVALPEQKAYLFDDAEYDGSLEARRVVDELLSTLDEAGVAARALEGEWPAMARALLPEGDTSTVLIVDIGKMTTKSAVVARRRPLRTATVGGGGHAFTLAAQKHFGVTEEEARRVKEERGIVPAPEHAGYLDAMRPAVAALEEEVRKRLRQWGENRAASAEREPIGRIILVGGNASVRGLAEHIENAVRLPVALGDVFLHFAPRSAWLPPLSRAESLSYAAAIGLALREYA